MRCAPIAVESNLARVVAHDTHSEDGRQEKEERGSSLLLSYIGFCHFVVASEDLASCPVLPRPSSGASGAMRASSRTSSLDQQAAAGRVLWCGR